MSSTAARVLRVGGVPEHFNAPWHTAAKAGLFAERGIDVRWTDFPGGTGAMAKALRDGELDVAILLTEGIVADIHRGNPARLVGTYVSSPLTWGIHVAADSPLTDAAQLYSQPAGDGGASPRFAVSRMTSGSHLMAFVDAQQRAGEAAAASLRFEIVGSLEGAREALREGRADGFMWEKFTTKPLVDSGEWRRVGECVTPWPCFALAATPAALGGLSGEILGASRHGAARLRAANDGVETIAAMYKLQPEDVTEWLQTARRSAPVSWASSPSASFSTLRTVAETLGRLGVLEPASLLPPEQLVCELVSDADRF
ncbi:hypothetical protein EMIHUDRAFT_242624 [Emiliania huxleyi CCMP1516]|uniref:Ca3427-like PBP 2 domain-containing protein n=2 Tax=Emiliania huxleyi TaxID=2903 RepID=A0A0D3J8E4_EMIH1|nr:hypothetical protein EMIHUDRAFT_242624 [Emiliania huxleyi CCMP1516]EOD19779.1 hypothetical protein EMIHUDRAFT_242624 [Emiliania huxleyi CCMP1516]|eukprot:XP_005772208.1 hypothetical protein EMIHUDRAFT_242624 [Emiliania huxleyi CCMP1516]